MIFHTALADESTRGYWDNINNLTIQVDLDSLRAIEMWSRWLYGQPMWSEDDCHNVDDDLECLMDIHSLCAGLYNGNGRDYEGLNACMDAIRDLLLSEVHVPSAPISLLVPEDYQAETMVKMLAELLVHGKCVSDGRTKEWLEQNTGQCQWVLEAISNEFAKKAMGEAPPDLMGRGAHHVHLPGSNNNPSPRGRVWKGSSILRR